MLALLLTSEDGLRTDRSAPADGSRTNTSSCRRRRSLDGCQGSIGDARPDCAIREGSSWPYWSLPAEAGPSLLLVGVGVAVSFSKKKG
ncbi:hypothetical protein BDA96_03G278500 [Sorghum bicolor]|uniref:Uncharacterized protein n=2 Tax=Sorghum bicolor TaxID=4558 RepID=A0A1W0VYY9_SORBI|nr:hypothetical protein BDA96_03G278500 [Sorghum bicolor]OQU87334.1 hypothetical protein SORBI_3003G257650 [Sorghum bicolor]